MKYTVPNNNTKGKKKDSYLNNRERMKVMRGIIFRNMMA